jgi:processive 1,2-diacylglycerol beta-glucosyltransferase
MTSLLILSSDTGEGHNSAASAIRLAAGSAGLRVSIRKPLEESGKLNRCLAGFYNALLTHRPQWMAKYFWLIDHSRPNERDFFYSKVRGYIASFLESEHPDILLSVHPMLNHFIQRYIKEEGLGIPCFTFVTDPFPPFWQGWASPYVDRFFVATAEALQGLTAMGIPAWRIERVPMPVRPEFQPVSRNESNAFRTALSLDEASTILINGGARGGGPLWSIYRTVRRASPASNIVVICGRNARLRRRLEGLHDARTRVLGFVDDIHRCVAASDLVLTKPGALSTFEALACGVPVLLLGVRGLMPQESGLFAAARRCEFGFAASQLREIEEVIARGPQKWGPIREFIAQFYTCSSGQELIERLRLRHAEI